MTTITFPALLGPGGASLRSRHTGWLLIPVTFYLIFILPVYVDNNAGSGLRMPQNLIAWGVMMLCVLLATARAAVIGRLHTGHFILAAVLAVLLLLLPWLWSPSPLWQRHALPRLAGITGAFFFALALCQMRLSSAQLRALLYAVVLSSQVQAAEAIMQAWLPALAQYMMDFAGTAPYGIFQQRNLLASWLATGFGVVLYLALTAKTRARAMGWITSLYPLCMALTLTSSRTGIVGVMIMLALAGLVDLPRINGRPLAILRRAMLLLSLLAFCAGTAHWAMPGGSPVDLSHTLSNRERVVMLLGAIRMAAEHPLAGSGLGSFEVLFPEVLARMGLRARSDTITHPHNEVLYVLDEGGIVALAGLILLAGIWLWPVAQRVRWLDSRWLLSLTGLPIVLHMMTEYPLYLSAPHLMLLLILFRAGLPEAALHEVRIPLSLRATVLPGLCLAVAVALALLATGFTTQRELTVAEADMNAGLIPPLPTADWRSLTQIERLDYDRHMLTANAPGFTRNPRAMSAFTVWGNRWLAVHNDAEVSAAMLFIARQRGDWDEAERLRARAARVFVHDNRFIRGKS